jgi:protein-S-isoprenylcysteine O-methyltransferase Ste14
MALQQEMVRQGNFLFRHRGTLPLLIIIPAILLRVCGIHTNWLQEHAELTTYTAYGISLLGLILRFIIVGHAAPNTSGRNTEGQIADTINSDGLYSVVRHPLYLGNFLMWLGPALLTFHSWFIGLFVFLYWIYYERIMLAEEDYLRNKFGEPYENWAAGRPAFIPDLSKWKPYQNKLIFYKALYQEKTGLLWLNLIFWIFNSADNFTLNASVFIVQPWSGLLFISIALYLILKITKRR